MTENPPSPQPPRASTLWAFLFTVGWLLAFVGVVALFLPALVQWSRSRVGKDVSDVPDKLTLAELLQRGLVGNPNVLLSDFSMGDDYLVTTRGDGPNAPWISVHVPIRPLGQAENGPFHAVLKSTKVSDASEFAKFRERRTIQGLVINNVASLSDQEINKLRERYPGTDFSKVLIVQADREPPRTDNPWIFYLSGAAMIVVGVVLGYRSGWANFKRYFSQRYLNQT
jgi:hypothetical protein